MMTIGQLAAHAELPPATIRYYEKRGLIPEPPRSRSGYRQYAPHAADRLRFIRRAQALGFELEDIGELLELRVEDAAACGAVEAHAREKLEAVRHKIRELCRMETTLQDLVVSCTARTVTDECPILDSLAEGSTDA